MENAIDNIVGRKTGRLDTRIFNFRKACRDETNHAFKHYRHHYGSRQQQPKEHITHYLAGITVNTRYNHNTVIGGHKEGIVSRVHSRTGRNAQESSTNALLTKDYSKYLNLRSRPSRMTESTHKEGASYRIDHLPDIVPIIETIVTDEKKETDDLIPTELSFAKMQSVKPYNSADEYLLAMKEDLADWLNIMYNADINYENLFEVLGNGSLLCQHANRVMMAIRKKIHKRIGPAILRRDSPNPADNKVEPADKHSLLVDVVYKRYAKPQSFAARDNVSNFISWARCCANVRECLMFETDDLIMLKNERNVILCLLEIARFGAAYGVQVPKLVRFEQDIAREIEHEHQKEFQSVTELRRNVEDQQRLAATRSHDWLDKAKQSIYNHIQGGNRETLKLLREQLKAPTISDIDDRIDPLLSEVTEILSECTCTNKIDIIPLGPGKYRFGSSTRTVFVRRLNNHLMVNVDQNQWDTFRNYITQMDPCRSTFHILGKRNYRRSKSAQNDETSAKSTILPSHKFVGNIHNEDSSSANKFLTPGRYVSNGRSVTDTIVKDGSQVSIRKHSRSQLSNSSSRSDASAESAASNQTAQGVPFRENRAYQWRRRALLFRKFINDTPKDERNVFTDQYINTHFHYSDLRGSELIYGDQADLAHCDNLSNARPSEYADKSNDIHSRLSKTSRSSNKR